MYRKHLSNTSVHHTNAVIMYDYTTINKYATVGSNDNNWIKSLLICVHVKGEWHYRCWLIEKDRFDADKPTHPHGYYDMVAYATQQLIYNDAIMSDVKHIDVWSDGSSAQFR
jgi:hypothetical protein